MLWLVDKVTDDMFLRAGAAATASLTDENRRSV